MTKPTYRAGEEPPAMLAFIEHDCDVCDAEATCCDDAVICTTAHDLARRMHHEEERLRIVEWLRDVAKFTNGGMLDDERIAKGIDEAWVVDPIDACALADAIERGEHRG